MKRKEKKTKNEKRRKHLRLRHEASLFHPKKKRESQLQKHQNWNYFG